MVRDGWATPGCLLPRAEAAGVDLVAGGRGFFGCLLLGWSLWSRLGSQGWATLGSHHYKWSYWGRLGQNRGLGYFLVVFQYRVIPVEAAGVDPGPRLH